MKKIIAILLLVCCVAAMSSCSIINKVLGKDDGEGNGNNAPTGFAAFTSAISATNASNVQVTSTTETSLGKLTTTLSVAFKNDGSAVINYSYERFNEIGEGAADEIKSTVTGTITRAADGTYSGDMIDGIDLSAVAAGPALNISSLESIATINEGGDVLTATVAAASSEAVFGSAFSKDVALEITIKDGAVKYIDIEFENGSVSFIYG